MGEGEKASIGRLVTLRIRWSGHFISDFRWVFFTLLRVPGKVILLHKFCCYALRHPVYGGVVKVPFSHEAPLRDSEAASYSPGAHQSVGVFKQFERSPIRSSGGQTRNQSTPDLPWRRAARRTGWRRPARNRHSGAGHEPRRGACREGKAISGS